MSAPRVSVIMSAYNAEDFVGASIESILSQTYGDFEFLIVNDGSKDSTRQIIEGYAARDGRIRLSNRDNKGLIYSLNQLIREARGELLARMDADDVAMPERLARQVEFLDKNSDFGVVGTGVVRIDQKGRPCGGPAIAPPDTHEGFLATIGKGPLLIHSSVMYRKSIVMEVGGYAPAFKHCEDLDLWLRLAPITRICSLPDALMQYRSSPTQISNIHVLEQNVNAAIAIHAWTIRRDGRPDPTRGAVALPKSPGIDRFFGERGVEKTALMQIIPHLLYSQRALTSGGLDLIARHLAYGGDRDALWRTVGRLVFVFGQWRSALSLARILVFPPPRVTTHRPLRRGVRFRRPIAQGDHDADCR